MKNELQPIRDALAVGMFTASQMGWKTQLEMYELCISTIDRLIAEHEGKVLVPIEPTEEMLEAIGKEVESFLHPDKDCLSFNALYKAMIALAPTYNGGE